MASSDSVEVVLRGPYYLNQLKRLIRELQPLLHLNVRRRVFVDLSDLTFMGPAALALTLGALSRIQSSSLLAPNSSIVPPRATGMATYLARMDFLTVLLEEAEPAVEVGRTPRAGLRECRHFRKDEECRAVAKELADALEERVSTDQLARTSLELCLTELTENVYYHAEAHDGGFAAAQAFDSSKEIEVAIVDLGVGIRRSLAKNADYAAESGDDVTAIETAMRPTVTATPGRNSGYGLAFTRFLLDINQGRLLVRSGTGNVQVGEKAFRKEEVDSLPGTLVALRLHTDRAFDFKKAYELLMEAISLVTRKS